jgi:hypothetical protein
MITTDYINCLIFALVGSTELVNAWWNSPNMAFEGLCPCDAPEDKVIAYLEFHCYG